MRRKAILITGAAGEVGQALIQQLAEQGANNLLTVDVRPLPAELTGTATHYQADILDKALFDRLVIDYDITTIYHMAAILSTSGEFNPMAAHSVNVEGTMRLLNLAAEQSDWKREPITFIFPSSVAIYGMQSSENKAKHSRPQEWEWNYPITMYGCNKLYGETLGVYYAKHYKQLSETTPTYVDFRCVRYPGLISAVTVPSGGTSDYGPEMLHAAAQGQPYACFVRPDSAIPFMSMPDAITATIQLAEAQREKLTRQIYNITAFSLTAEEIAARVQAHFPGAQISYEPHLKRQRIVDSWPIDMNDDAARRDWAWQPAYNAERSFDEYLVPNIRARYNK